MVFIEVFIYTQKRNTKGYESFNISHYIFEHVPERYLNVTSDLNLYIRCGMSDSHTVWVLSPIWEQTVF